MRHGLGPGEDVLGDVGCGGLGGVVSAVQAALVTRGVPFGGFFVVLSKPLLCVTASKL